MSENIVDMIQDLWIMVTAPTGLRRVILMTLTNKHCPGQLVCKSVMHIVKTDSIHSLNV